MEPHVIAFGIDPAHIVDRDPQQFGAVRDPQFLEPFAVALAIPAAPRQRAFDRAFEPVRGDGFEHVIHGIEIECLDGKMFVRGDEDHRRPHAQPGDRARERQAVHPRHGHVEQEQVGRQRLDQLEPRLTVMGGADDFDLRQFGADHLQPVDRERLIVDQERAEGLSHGGSPECG